LTDERVLYRRAPFDHPELDVTNGAAGDERTVELGPDGAALDRLLHIDAVGAEGGEPLLRFLQGPRAALPAPNVLASSRANQLEVGLRVAID
jgi:hypothetical protein